MAVSLTRAQSTGKPMENAKPDDVPEIINTHIPGAPMLQKPLLIKGPDGPLVAKGNGIAAPAFFDWDGDGKKDLLVGEFCSGVEFGPYMGSFVRVYKNKGSNEAPKFDGKYDYARPYYKQFNSGAVLSATQGCCMGFTPEFIDMNNDGRPDLVTGSYGGQVFWCKGLEEGFSNIEQISQTGDPNVLDYKLKGLNDVKSQYYWAFSPAAFGDFNGDGLIDMITGGYTLRISVNTGTKEQPFFSHREFLLTPKGDTLQMKNTPPTPDELQQINGWGEPAIWHMISPVAVDWDGDGVLDILATNHYKDASMPAVMFFKGVKTPQGPRFQPGISLFTGKADGKVLPGRWLHASVADWNNDGVNDLLIGTSVMTLNDYQFSGYLSWNWEHETGVQKYDPALLSFTPADNVRSWVDYYMKEKSILPKIPADQYMTARHCGYVYVLLGKK